MCVLGCVVGIAGRCNGEVATPDTTCTLNAGLKISLRELHTEIPVEKFDRGAERRPLEVLMGNCFKT